MYKEPLTGQTQEAPYMFRRIVILALAVALSTAALPASVFGEESRPLASLRTAEGLKNALQAAGPVQLQQEPAPAGGGGSFLSTRRGKVILGVGILAAAAAIVAVVWHGPDPTRADE